MTSHRTRTGLIGMSTVAALSLAACGGGGGDDGEIQLRFAWWGSDSRHQYTQEIIDIYEEQNPGITIEPQYNDWDGYFDQLATQTAGGDAPDIIQMEDQYLREYADRGALLDVSDVDVSAFDDVATELGDTGDGIFGVTLGLNAYGFIANPDLFDEAGLELPDDTTWTWEDFTELSSELNDALGDDRYGGTGIGSAEVSLRYWMHQQGQELFDQEGEFLLTEELAEEYLRFVMDTEDAGDFPSADWMEEQEGLGPEDSALGTNTAAFGDGWAAMIVAFGNASGSDLELLRIPSTTGDVTDNGEWLKASMFLSASADTDHPEEAMDFIDFFVNSEEAAELMGLERGVPANADIRDAALQDATDEEVKMAEFIAEVEEDAADIIPTPPAGASQMASIIGRYLSEVRFGSTDIEDAAVGMVAELEESFE
ncbi:ABC transporter substrate-binding protein [Nesterenkonia alba]|uniref:ABC transporter substrate-binding protein n=1 Tax=Nesterenkonia alba TaxID=515814 RepID=UPI0003B43EEF|nr:extracellular solute-binding protein [Nesterenkonia alba]